MALSSFIQVVDAEDFQAAPFFSIPNKLVGIKVSTNLVYGF